MGLAWVVLERRGHFLLCYQSPFLEGSMYVEWKCSRVGVFDFLVMAFRSNFVSLASNPRSSGANLPVAGVLLLWKPLSLVFWSAV